MVQLAGSLLSWLAATGPSSSLASVVTCSNSAIQLAEGSSLQVGDIFVRFDSESPSLCRDDCSVLFREILSDDGNGVYQTAPASFSQVFSAEAYDRAYRNTPVESILPSCKEDDATYLKKAEMERRSLQGEAPEPAPAPIARGKGYDDDYSHSGSSSYEDDYYEDAVEHGPFRQFLDATKKFIFDMYCIVRQLDCTEYHPGDDDYDDDYSGRGSKSGSGSKDHRLLQTPPQANSGVRRAKTKGVKGAKPARSLQTTEVSATTSTVNILGVASGGSGSGSGSGSKSGSGSGSHEDDDDDFYDDDYTPDDSGANFWKVLDAVCVYVESLWCIFKGTDCEAEEHYEDDEYDDDHSYDSKDNGKHIRGLLEEEVLPPATAP